MNFPEQEKKVVISPGFTGNELKFMIACCNLGIHFMGENVSDQDFDLLIKTGIELKDSKSFIDKLKVCAKTLSSPEEDDRPSN